MLGYGFLMSASQFQRALLLGMSISATTLVGSPSPTVRHSIFSLSCAGSTVTSFDAITWESTPIIMS